ncbi:chromate efflux transporter [Aurantimonas sp. A2-1-M11]|uniref:chromate efflux transporter n=1 Tax=Aurantimonas sp. A2-1-M11 TaxID=3113712 RepID=UPI002F924EFA
MFRAFLKLGFSAFGGPIAHLGYFRDEFVTRRLWLDETGYGDLVALCQFLPGPASSQVGFAIGLMRAGPLGALAAWTAFTLPSAILLILFAAGAQAFESGVGAAIVHGLKIVAVAVVAQAVFGMARTLCPDRTRATIALVAVVAVVVVAGSLGQIAAIVMGGLTGLVFCRAGMAATPPAHVIPVSRRVGLVALAVFAILLVLLPILAATTSGAGPLALFDAFYRAGALVFGGGHVVLPLLQAFVVEPGWASEDAFLAGYGAAQAVPGPLFTFAAYLGAIVSPKAFGIAGAAIALVAIFLPGMLLVVAALPFWDAFRRRVTAQAAMRGANAAVVGILGAALYDPVFVSAVRAPADFALALAGFVLLVVWKAPPWTVVLFCALISVAIA